MSIFDVMDINNCSGCEVCSNICPTDSIEMVKDDIGFLIPIRNEKCIECGRCINICPRYSRKPECGLEERYFGISNKDENVLIKSASGGAFTFLRNGFLEEYPNGWVCGVVYKEDFSGAVHLLSQDDLDFERMRSSKYLQSEKGYIYRKIKEKLKNDEAVLFSGSACEVDALIRFLGNRYEKLWTVDYICKGTTSPKVFKDYISNLEKKYKSKVKHVNMRHKWKKLDSWIPQFLYITFENGKKLLKQFYNTEIGSAFLILQRECCKTCLYREKKHYSDFTIGDYHGPIFEKSFGHSLGTSVLITNSDRAFKKWTDMDKESISFAEITKKEIYAYNRNPEDQRIERLKRNLALYDGVTAVRRSVGVKDRIKFLMPTKIMRTITMRKRRRCLGE